MTGAREAIGALDPLVRSWAILARCISSSQGLSHSASATWPERGTV